MSKVLFFVSGALVIHRGFRLASVMSFLNQRLKCQTLRQGLKPTASAPQLCRTQTAPMPWFQGTRVELWRGMAWASQVGVWAIAGLSAMARTRLRAEAGASAYTDVCCNNMW